jgi:putative membrane protein
LEAGEVWVVLEEEAPFGAAVLVVAHPVGPVEDFQAVAEVSEEAELRGIGDKLSQTGTEDGSMRRLRAEEFFTDTEKEKIRISVENVEASTSGEIATMVVNRSDSYREAEILGAILIAGLFALIIEVLLEYIVVTTRINEWSDISYTSTQIFLHGISVWTYIPLVFLLFFPSRYIFRKLPALKLPFVGRRRVEEAVRERAVRAFYEKELFRTRDETGVLIFISLLEHKVWILGDRGIDRKIPRTLWQEFARDLSVGLHEKRACDTLCEIIGKMGRELALYFPRRTDDTNELTDKIIH